MADAIMDVMVGIPMCTWTTSRTSTPAWTAPMTMRLMRESAGTMSHFAKSLDDSNQT